jgi:O-antigen ligase
MILFYILLLSLPFVDHGLFGMTFGSLTLEKIIGALCFLYALTYLPRRRELPMLFSSAQAKAFAFYVAIAVISYVTTAEEIVFIDMVGIFLSQFLFFIAVMILVDSRERLETTVLMVTASIGIVSLYLIKEWLGNVGAYGLSYRPGWVAGDPNMFSASALIVLPMMMCPIRFAPRWWQRAGAAFSLVVTLIAFVLAASRGGFIGLVCMFLWQLHDMRRRVIAVLVFAAILAVAFVSPYSPLDRLIKPNESDLESSNIRLQLWSVSGKIFHDHPVFGVGLYNFPTYMHKYLPPGVDLDFVVPHNTYLEAAVELGAVGLAFFLSVMGFSLWSLARMRRMAVAAKDAYYTLLSTSVGSGIVGFGAAAMFLSAKHAKLFWFAVFLSACMQPLVEQSLNATQAKEADEATAASTAVLPPVPAALPAVPAALPVESAPLPQEAATSEPTPIRVGNWLTRH